MKPTYCSRFFFLLIFLSLHLHGVLNVRAQENTILTPLKTEGYNLGETPFTLQIPVVLKANTDINSLKVQIIDVSLAQERKDSFLKAFSLPTIKKESEETIAYIETAIDTSKLNKLGIYNLYLAVTSNELQQFITINLIRPETTLQPIPEIKIIQESYIPLFLVNSEGQPLLIEVQNTPLVSELNITQQEFMNASGETSNAQIKFDSAKIPLSPGNPINLNYTVNGIFPIGENTGKIRLSSPQFKNPVIANFKVFSRLSHFYILFFLILGLAAGWFSRRKLKEFIERSEAKKKAIELIDKIKPFLKHPDNKFGQTAETLSEELKNALNEESTSKINEIVTTNSEAFETARIDFQTRKENSIADYQLLVKIIESKERMPLFLREFLQRFEIDINSAKPLLKDEMIDAFKISLDKARESFAIELIESVKDWLKWQEGVLFILDAPAELSIEVNERVKNAIVQIQPIIDKVKNLTNSSDTTTTNDLMEILQVVYQIDDEVQSLFGQISNWLKTVESKVITTLNLGKIAETSAIENLRSQVKSLTDLLESEIEINQSSESEISSAIETMEDAWYEAIQKQVPSNIKDDNQEKLEEFLNEYKYGEAAQFVTRLNRENITLRNNKAGEIMLGRKKGENLDAANSAVFDSITLNDFRLSGKTLQNLEYISSDSSTPQKTDLNSIRSKVKTELWQAKSLQFAIISLSIIFVGYLLFADNFIGTIKELGAIFFWAFGLDVTLDKLIEKSTSLAT